MPLNLSIATIYVMDGFRANFILTAELMRAIAINSTIADLVTQDIYYLFGFIHWLSYYLNDLSTIINSNSTLLRFLVGYWQKVALNATTIFGDWQGTQGIAYLWNQGLSCIQPGRYCYNLGYGNLTTLDALDMVRWTFNATSEVGRRLSTFYPWV